MASNPMQRKSRNSFLIGVIITLLITGVIIAVLLLALKQKNEELLAEKQAKRMVYTLSQDVSAGQILTENMFSLKSIHMDSIPSNATATTEVIQSWFLQTKEGESVCRDKYGLYLDRSLGDKAADTIIEVVKNDGDEMVDSKGNKIATGDYYVEVDGIIEKVTSTSNIQKDEYGMFFVDTQGNDKITRVYQEDLTDEFYVYKIDTTMNTTNTKVRIKEYISIKNVPVLAKVNMKAKTVITSELVVQSSEVVTDDTREKEYNMIVLPIDLMTDDYVDIRYMTPSGQDFIVISKARVEVPMNADGTYITDTIRINLREDEILALSSAIVESYGLKGSKLYATKYVEPAMQPAAIATYTPNAAVTAQIQTDPNIVEMAMEELAARYSEASKKVRNDYIQTLLDKAEGYNQNVQGEQDSEIGASITARKKYLDSLNY